jgi:hypothetical protein
MPLPTGFYREEYVQEVLEFGWTCRNTACAAKNSDKEKFLLACAICGAPRPRKETVARGTKGKW